MSNRKNKNKLLIQKKHQKQVENPIYKGIYDCSCRGNKFIGRVSVDRAKRGRINKWDKWGGNSGARVSGKTVWVELQWGTQGFVVGIFPANKVTLCVISEAAEFKLGAACDESSTKLGGVTLQVDRWVCTSLQSSPFGHTPWMAKLRQLKLCQWGHSSPCWQLAAKKLEHTGAFADKRWVGCSMKKHKYG